MRNLLKFAQELEVQMDDLLKIAQETSTQKGDVYKALKDAKFLGITGSDMDPQWDTNSAFADFVFGKFDLSGYQGSLNLSVSFDPKKQVVVSVVCSPKAPQIEAAVKGQVEGKIKAVLAKLPPPADTLTLSGIVQARNV